MRILFAIPHFHAQQPDRPGPRHGAYGNAQNRLAALTACVSALHQHYGQAQCVMQIGERRTQPANDRLRSEIRVVICTTLEKHLLGQIRLAPTLFEQHATDVDPLTLGFQCHKVLRDRWGDYDFYGYLEDDLILHDPWLFAKLAWFNGHVGQDKVLLPNRFERGTGPLAHKAYVDGDLARHVTAPFQDLDDGPTLKSHVMGQELSFHRPLNPHSGCFFLNAEQMKHWMDQPGFLDGDISFVGPLESAATLGIMRTFKIYKPARQNASFLEIEHFGTQFLSLIRKPAKGS